MRSIYLTDYYNSGQKIEEEFNRTADMMAHSRKQQGQYRKIIKDDNPVSSDSSSVPSSISSSTIPSVPSSSTSYTSLPTSVPSTVPSSNTPSTSRSSSSSTSSTPVIPMPDDQF